MAHTTTCGKATLDGVRCTKQIGPKGTCGATHRSNAPDATKGSGLVDAGGAVAAADPFARTDREVATDAAEALGTIGRWHADFAADVLDALARSGADSTESRRFHEWVADATGRTYAPVPFGRVVVALRDTASEHVAVVGTDDRAHIARTPIGGGPSTITAAHPRRSVAGPVTTTAGHADAVAIAATSAARSGRLP